MNGKQFAVLNPPASKAGTDRIEVRIGGFGGQGIILAGYLFGKGAALYDGQEAIFTQVYGPEARGGACTADVVLSRETIGFPEVTRPHVLAVLSQEAADLFVGSLDPGGMLLLDEDLVKIDWPGRTFAVPATRVATDLGRRIVANMVMLGFLSAVTGLVAPDSLKEAIRTTVRPSTIDLNLRAFDAGFEHGVAQRAAEGTA